jgi:hypothetical protein
MVISFSLILGWRLPLRQAEKPPEAACVVQFL